MILSFHFCCQQAYIRRHGSPQTMETLEEHLSYKEQAQSAN